MGNKVSLFGGKATIPLSWYLTIIRSPYTHEDSPHRAATSTTFERMEELLDSFPLSNNPILQKYDGVVPKEVHTAHGDSGSNEERSIGDVVDSWLIEQARKNKRDKGRGKFEDNERGEKGKTQVKGSLGDDTPSWIDEPQMGVVKNSYLGTNQILEQILGLSDVSSRTRFLMKLMDGNCTDNGYEKCVEGAYVVRAAFHLAQFYGLMENYSGNPQKRAKIFRAILDSVSKGGIQITDSLIEHFGLKEMPGLMSRHLPFREFDALVPKGHVYTIASAMEMPGLRHLRGPDLMLELGYKPVYHFGTPILYYMPKPR